MALDYEQVVRVNHFTLSIVFDACQRIHTECRIHTESCLPRENSCLGEHLRIHGESKLSENHNSLKI